MFAFSYVSLIICLLFVALFAASEAALAATSRVRLRQLLRARHDNEENAAAPAGELSRDEQRFIATVTIAANIPLVLAAVLAVWIAQDSFGLGREAALISTSIALLSVPVFQVAPRLLAAQPGALKQWWWVRPARFLVVVLSPLVTLMMGLGSVLLRITGLLPPAAPNSASNESETGLENANEIRDLVENVQAAGMLDEGKELIESIFGFGDTRVHEIMVPRPDIVALPLECTWDRVLDTMQESGLSRIPVYEGNIDRVVGVLHAKDVLRQWNLLDTIEVKTSMRAPLFVPESRKIDEAFSSMRAQRSHLAIIIDEYGGTSGLLTVEDILEELVGEIADEHDHQVEEALVILDENTALVDARLHIEDLRDDWNLDLPSGEFDTVGGFVIEQLGRAPIVGDQVETAQAVLTVHAVRARRPKKIMINRKTEAASATAE